MVTLIFKWSGSGLKSLKGKGITDFAKNLESEGWPTEFESEAQRDKVKYLERKLERPLNKQDIRQYLPKDGQTTTQKYLRRKYERIYTRKIEKDSGSL